MSHSKISLIDQLWHIFTFRFGKSQRTANHSLFSNKTESESLERGTVELTSDVSDLQMLVSRISETKTDQDCACE